MATNHGTSFVKELEVHLNVLDKSDFREIAAKVQKLNQVEMDYLDSCWQGGGNPAKHFLEDLQKKHGTDTVQKLYDAIKKYDPGAAQIILNEARNGLRLSGLPVYVIITLSDSLRSTWTGVANEFEYTPERIDNIRAYVRRDGQFSPTWSLFTLLRKQHPDVKLITIFEALPTEGQEILKKYMLALHGFEMNAMDVDDIN